jgi:hypothetical protein
MFDLEDNCTKDRHDLALLSVRLANWIYGAATKEACPLIIEELFLQDDDHNQQWAIVTNPDDDETVHVVFRGTASMRDIFVDLNAMTQTLDDCGIGVHGGMWGTLHPHGKPQAFVPTVIATWLEKHRSGQPTKLVMCGHSLGGGYATLATLALLRGGILADSVSVQVITFGSPQVLARPMEEYGLWEAMEEVSTHYVHGCVVLPVNVLAFNYWWITLSPVILVFCSRCPQAH